MYKKLNFENAIWLSNQREIFIILMLKPKDLQF